jgi:hypothetical protein
MNRTIKVFKRILLYMVTGSLSVFISACYGVLVKSDFYGIWTVTVKNNLNQPIKGLEVTFVNDRSSGQEPFLYTVHTDNTGSASANLVANGPFFKAGIHDTDGFENSGMFADTSITWDGISMQDTIIIRKVD